MIRRIAVAAAAVGLAGLLVPLLAVPAVAHGEHKVANYTFVVGFGTEPAYAGAPNSVQLILSAFFIPTSPGAYTFHFTGTIKGKKIDQSFTSVKDGFDEMTDPAEVQYPAVEPSGTQLSGRLDRESARLNAALTAERDQAKDDAASASRLATIGLIVGALGLVAAAAVGFLALRRQS